MIYRLEETSKVEKLFEGWEETLIYSCMQKVMGDIFVTDVDKPKSAYAKVSCFCFYAGKPDKELVLAKPEGFIIMTPQNEDWERLIEECYPDCKKVTRYAIKKNTAFDREKLRQIVSKLPTGYEIKNIDSGIYDMCLTNPVTADFVSAFSSKEKYLELGRGKVILKDDKIVAGASSFSRYKEGIEIEVDTVPDERQKGLAAMVCSALILDCLDEGLYPSWDAQNMISVHLAEKLGYEYDHEYVAYEVASECRIH